MDGEPSVSTPLLPSKQGDPWRQYLASLLACLLSMATGCVAGWSAPAIPYLQNNVVGALRVDTPITDSEASWIASIITIGAILGAVPAGQLSYSLGRKWFLLLLAFPSIIGWLLIIYAEHHVMLLILGRFTTGIAFGACSVGIPLYNAEIVADSIRGRVGVFFDLLLCFGILWAYVWGALTSLHALNTACAAVSIVFFACFYWMPESPVYLMLKNRPGEAEESLRWLRGPRFDVENELLRLHRIIEEGKNLSPRSGDDMNTFWKQMKRFQLKSPTGKAMIITMGLMTFQRFSGVSALIYYSVDIFRNAGTKISPSLATIIVGAVQIVASLLSSLLIDKLGRRFLLLTSEITMAVCQFVLVFYFVFKNQGYDMQDYSWVPIVSVCTIVAIFRVGIGPIPWFMMAELMPLEAKVWSSSFLMFYSWSCLFIVSKGFIDLVDLVGSAPTYGLLGLICLLGTVFVTFKVPETRNKSFETIQSELSIGYQPL
uniref:Facilitated trehalose transporter Tret1 n=1 Tax=Cacopsylla melanoneura TaxID=428564 RepID=A0A8D8WUQ2_9HEMI